MRYATLFSSFVKQVVFGVVLFNFFVRYSDIAFQIVNGKDYISNVHLFLRIELSKIRFVEGIHFFIAQFDLRGEWRRVNDKVFGITCLLLQRIRQGHFCR